MVKLPINEYYIDGSAHNLTWKGGVIRIMHNIAGCPVNPESINEGIREICRMYNHRFPSLRMQFYGEFNEPGNHTQRDGIVVLNWVDVIHMRTVTGRTAFGYVRNIVGFENILSSNLFMRNDTDEGLKTLLKVIMHEFYHVIGAGHINVKDTLMGVRPIDFSFGAWLFPGDIANLTWFLNGEEAAPAIFDPTLIEPEMELFVPCILDKVTNKDYYWARLIFAGYTLRRPEHMSDLPFKVRPQWKVEKYGHFDDIAFYNVKEYIGPESNVSLLYLHKRLRIHDIYPSEYKFAQLDKLSTGRWLLTDRKER